MFDRIAETGQVYQHVPAYEEIIRRIAHDGIGPEHAIDCLFDTSKYFCANTQAAISGVRDLFGEKKFLTYELKHQATTVQLVCNDYTACSFSICDSMQDDTTFLNCSFFHRNGKFDLGAMPVAPEWIVHKLDAMKMVDRLVNYCYMPYIGLIRDIVMFVCHLYKDTHQFHWYENENKNFSIIGVSLYSNEAFQITSAGEEILAYYDVAQHQQSDTHNSFQDNRGRTFTFQ